MVSTARISFLQLVVTPFLLLVSSPLCKGQEPVACTAGIVAVGEQVTITCHFQRDINASQHNFNVVHYPFNRSDTDHNSGTYILLCNWGSSGSLGCKTEEGYSFNNKVRSELTITIPTVNFEMAGLYVCQLVPDNGLQIQPCNLTVTDFGPTKGWPNFTDWQTFLAGREADVREDTHLLYIIVILVIIITVLVVLLIISQRLKIWYLWKRIRHKNSTGGKSKRDGVAEAKEENELALLEDLNEIHYPENTAHKQTHTYLVTVEKDTQVGTNVVTLTHERFTQVLKKDKKLFTGNFKANEGDKDKELYIDNLKVNEGDVVITGSASRYNSQVYVTLGTPLVVVPEASVEKIKLKTEQSQGHLEGAEFAFVRLANTPDSFTS